MNIYQLIYKYIFESFFKKNKIPKEKKVIKR